MVAVDALRTHEFNSYWKTKSKSKLKFLSRIELNNYVKKICRYPEGFRDEETELNLRRLHTKCKKNGLMLATCMANTFSIRKFDIRGKQLGVNTIIKKYPGLSDYYQELKSLFKQIQEEFQRIAEKDVFQFEEEVRDMLWAAVPMDISRLPKCKSPFWKDNNDAGCGTLRRLTFFIHDKMDGVDTDDFIIYKLSGQKGKVTAKVKRDHPTILVDETIWGSKTVSVYLEKVRVLTGLSFFDAFLASYYLYYIFDMEYATDKVNMWKALDQILANVNDKKEPSIDCPDEN